MRESCWALIEVHRAGHPGAGTAATAAPLDSGVSSHPFTDTPWHMKGTWSGADFLPQPLEVTLTLVQPYSGVFAPPRYEGNTNTCLGRSGSRSSLPKRRVPLLLQSGHLTEQLATPGARQLRHAALLPAQTRL